MTVHRVSLEAFEGPLNLLLHLVRHDEVDIYEISLERLTRQYLDYLDEAAEWDIPLAGEFIVMAAHLMLLKSRELLPPPSPTPGDEEEDSAPSWELIRQLLEYRKFKDAAAHLGQAESERALLYPPHPASPTHSAPPNPEADLSGLFAAFHRVLDRTAATRREGEIPDDRWTVADKIASLRQVPTGRSLRFQELFRTGSSRGELIVTFLALLELMRIHEFRATQNGFLGDIELHRL